MPSRHIELTDHFDQFVNAQIEAGRFRDASEVLRAGLRLLEQETLEDGEKLALLRSLAAAGFDELDQGKGIQLRDARSIETFLADLGELEVKRSTPKRNGG